MSDKPTLVETTGAMSFEPWHVPGGAIVQLPNTDKTHFIALDHLRINTIDDLTARLLDDLYAAVEATSPWVKQKS